MIRRFLAGILLIAGGAAIAVGVFENWATVPATGQNLDGFSMGSTSVDAVVSFAVAALLVLLGLAIILSGGLISRGLGFLFSVLAVAWAALIVFLVSSLNHDVNHLVPAVSLVRHLEIGYALTAGGAVLAFIGGLIGLSVPRRTVTTVGHAMPVTAPVQREKTMALADRATARGAGWGPPDDDYRTPTSVDERTPEDVGSGRAGTP